MTHICVGKLNITGSGNGLSPGRRQDIIWTNAEILLIGPLGTNYRNFNRNSSIFIEENTFENVVYEMLFISSRPHCGQNVINEMATGHTWWRHQMETVSALLAICAGNSPVPGEFPTQRPVTRGFDVFFDLRPNKRLSKQPRGWWFETPSWSLWRHRNGTQGIRLSNVHYVNQTVYC